MTAREQIKELRENNSCEVMCGSKDECSDEQVIDNCLVKELFTHTAYLPAYVEALEAVGGAGVKVLANATRHIDKGILPVDEAALDELAAALAAVEELTPCPHCGATPCLGDIRGDDL